MHQEQLFETDDTNGAIIVGNYRYRLWRVWDTQKRRVLFIMLNPSTADANKNDPTIQRCIGFAQSWQAGSIEVVNLYAYRASDPAKLSQTHDAIGPENDTHIRQAATRADTIICAWGTHKQAQARSKEILDLLVHRELHCLGITRGGHPHHPLYVPANAQVIQYPSSM